LSSRFAALMAAQRDLDRNDVMRSRKTAMRPDEDW
jgi:hypothetical protein